jgi:hypothetical protein
MIYEDNMSLYGFCPVCGFKGVKRERRPNGNDMCPNGHEYPSRNRVLVDKESKPKRIVDINGDIIVDPQHYHESLRWAREMIDSMEAENVDRSDMLVLCNRLAEEVRFALIMLRGRDADP